MNWVDFISAVAGKKKELQLIDEATIKEWQLTDEATIKELEALVASLRRDVEKATLTADTAEAVLNALKEAKNA